MTHVPGIEALGKLHRETARTVGRDWRAPLLEDVFALTSRVLLKHVLDRCPEQVQREHHLSHRITLDLDLEMAQFHAFPGRTEGMGRDCRSAGRAEQPVSGWYRCRRITTARRRGPRSHRAIALSNQC